jgi:hypothetical protein
VVIREKREKIKPKEDEPKPRQYVIFNSTLHFNTST